MVWPDMEPGTVPADQRQIVAAGAERGRNDPPYYLQEYGGRGRDGCAGAEGRYPGEADCGGQGTAVLKRYYKEGGLGNGQENEYGCCGAGCSAGCEP